VRPAVQPRAKPAPWAATRVASAAGTPVAVTAGVYHMMVSQATSRTTSSPSTAACRHARVPRCAAGGYSWAEGILGVPQVSVEWSRTCRAPCMGDRGIRGVMGSAPPDTVTARSRLCSVRYDSEKSVCTSYSALRRRQPNVPSNRRVVPRRVQHWTSTVRARRTRPATGAPTAPRLAAPSRAECVSS
jgi:hypothetical protein